MKTHILKVERLEQRQMLAADLGLDAVCEPAGTQECMQAQECAELCPGGQSDSGECVSIRSRFCIEGPQESQALMWQQGPDAGAQNQNQTGEGEAAAEGQPAETGDQVQDRTQTRDRICETVEPLQVRLRDQAQDGDCNPDCDGEGPVQTQAGDGQCDGEGPIQTQAGDGQCDGEGPTQTQAGDGQCDGEGPTQTQAGDGQCDGEGPTQTQTQTGEGGEPEQAQTQTLQSEGEGVGPIIETPTAEQTQTQSGEQTQSGDCTGDPTQTQQQSQTGGGEQTGTGDQTQTQTMAQDGSCEDDTDLTDSALLADVALESMIVDDIDPPETRTRTGADSEVNEDAAHKRPRDGQSW